MKDKWLENSMKAQRRAFDQRDWDGFQRETNRARLLAEKRERETFEAALMAWMHEPVSA